LIAGAGVAAVVAGCAAPSPKSAAESAPAQYPAQGYGYGASQPAANQPAPAPATQAPESTQSEKPVPAPLKKGEPPGSPSGGAPARAAELRTAASTVESSQRELDVAAGDCRNACRALGSMDRATGRLCELASGGDEVRRCEDARRSVYTARDRVKATCGDCQGSPSVERRDPIPSVR